MPTRDAGTKLYSDIFGLLPVTRGERPEQTKMTTRFSPVEKGERGSQRIERRAWGARLFLPQLITEGRGWGARLFLSQLIYPPPTFPPPIALPDPPPPNIHLPRTREEGRGQPAS